jgi:hypothetical protein
MKILHRSFALFSGTLATTFLFGNVAIASGAMQHWDAFSRSAEGITGDIDLSSSRIVFQNGTALELSYVGSIPGIIENTPGNLPTQIYRILKPQNPILLHGNPLCDQSAYYVAWVELPMVPFDGLNLLLLNFIKGRAPPRADMDTNRKCGGVALTREVGKR